MTKLFIGTYPPLGLGTPPGKGEGVWLGELGLEGDLTATQVLTLDSPSYVASHPTLPRIYAVSETTPTRVAVLDADSPDTLLANIEIGGSSGCHATVIANGRTLVVANYSSGDIAVVKLDEGGLPESGAPHQMFEHEGSGPRTDRQEGPHAHFVGLSPSGSHLLVADLGSDRLWRYSVTEEGLLTEPGVAAILPGGSGPRHFATHGNNLYVVCELDHSLRTLRWDPVTATAEVIHEQPVTLAPQRTGSTVYDAHVEVVTGPYGVVVLASVRGADVISVFDLSPEGEARYRTAFDTGYWPRHFAIATDMSGIDQLVVTAEKGHEIRSYALRDILSLPAETEVGGVVQLPYKSAPVTSPACIRPTSW